MHVLTGQGDHVMMKKWNDAKWKKIHLQNSDPIKVVVGHKTC